MADDWSQMRAVVRRLSRVKGEKYKRLVVLLEFDEKSSFKKPARR